MRHLKFNGILEEIVDRYPNIDISEFIEEKLEIPSYKAEELAARIKKEYCLKFVDRTDKNFELQILEKIGKSEQTPKASVYSLSNLSEKEFEDFLKWLFEELGYEVEPKKYDSDSSVDLVAAKDGEKIAIHARKYPKNCKVSNSILLVSQEVERICGCDRSIIVVTACFSLDATADAQKLGIELWDRDTLNGKITEVREKADLETQSCFPLYEESLLHSLLRLEDTTDFIIEPRAGGKYDLHLPGVKFPLLTFQVNSDSVIRCVFRIKNNEPVGENEGVALIKSDRNNNRVGPVDLQAYASIIQYLAEFLN